MAFIKTTLTDDITGQNAEFCFNTDPVIAMQPARGGTILTSAGGQKPAKFVGAKEKLD